MSPPRIRPHIPAQSYRPAAHDRTPGDRVLVQTCAGDLVSLRGTDSVVRRVRASGEPGRGIRIVADASTAVAGEIIEKRGPRGFAWGMVLQR